MGSFSTRAHSAQHLVLGAQLTMCELGGFIKSSDAEMRLKTCGPRMCACLQAFGHLPSVQELRREVLSAAYKSGPYHRTGQAFQRPE